MTMNDETLSAFLDGELAAEEMAAVREAVAQDPTLGERLAALVLADGLVRKQARALDDRPMPEAVLRLLREEAPAPAGKVVSLDSRRGAWGRAAVPTALAASLALVIGFVAGQFSSPPEAGGMPRLAAYSAALDGSLSGEAVRLDDEMELLSRFSFRDRGGNYCRQYRLQSQELASENVACRIDETWSLMASVQLPATPPELYRPAAGPALLDAILESLMQGQALSLDEEERLIRTGWLAGD